MFIFNTLLIVFVLLILSEIATFIVFGCFASKKDTELLMNLDPKNLELNKYSKSILRTEPFISTLPFSIFAKYYINDKGIVPRWSKLHKKIKEYYIIANQNN